LTSATDNPGISEGAALDFESVVERYQEKVYGITYRMTGNHADADCVTQETFLKAFKGFAKFQGRANLGTWLYRIASNACLDFLRKRGRHQSLQEGAAAGRPASDDRPDDEAAVAERRLAVRDALNELSQQDRMLITLTSMEGLSHRETAEALDMPVGTVSWKVSSIKSDLAEKLSRFLEEEL
jgi:RNA polymerase sigma-70 factor (ECF subfamily)